ncbi:DEAD/DEAH box helicase [Salinicoccus sp. YB14-2]|uniref:DEAD/DEAH box helicase n=1 Tax=Salinicoccus sp. YB14-2 TaxID=1572701 RepID=UPI000690037B|nr:DEAD/DEAH box helicase [Salinicoccus sp. YB14-2]
MLRNKKDVKRLENELHNIGNQVSSYSEESFDKDIKNLWQKLKVRTGNAQLKSMHIDTISTLEKGMPINLLVNNGLRTIYDVAPYDVNQLTNINGIGDTYAALIHDAVTRIKESVYQQAHPRMDPDNLADLDLKLIETVYRKREILTKAEKAGKLLKQYKSEGSPYITAAKKKKNLFMGLFQSSDEKEAVEHAFGELNKEQFQDKLEQIKTMLNHIEGFSVSEYELIEHFINNNAAYYIEIEKVTGYSQVETAGDIPSEIVNAVEAFPLDTSGLDLTLRHYQEFGAKYGLLNKRTLLGDEMGLGKTIQAMAMINHLRLEGKKHAIVVCPLSVIANWKREIQKFSRLKVFIFHGNGRDEAFERWKTESGVMLTTYGHAGKLDRDEIPDLNVLIVDEAHFVKNPGARRSESVYKLGENTEYVLYMSGTPLENRLAEMKQLIRVLQPELADQLTQELYLLEPKAFKRTVAPVYLRRNRVDVLGELPELDIIPKWTEFGKDESRYYKEAVLNEQLMKMRRAAWTGGTPEKSPKLEVLLDICEEAADNGHKVLVFSYFRDVMRTIERHLGDCTFEPISGDVPNTRRQEIIDEFTKAEPGSVLISQIQAGGVGLNIQAANIIILCEPQWKPSTEEQAIARAYRMGQSRNVVVYRLLTEDSIDVSMLEILGEKSELFDVYARESQIASIAMNDSDASIKQKVMEMEQQRVAERVE